MAQQTKYCYIKRVYFNADGTVSTTKTKLINNALRVKARLRNFETYIDANWFLCASAVNNLPQIMIDTLLNYALPSQNEISETFIDRLQDDIKEELNRFLSPECIAFEISPKTFEFKMKAVDEAQERVQNYLQTQRLVFNC